MKAFLFIIVFLLALVVPAHAGEHISSSHGYSATEGKSFAQEFKVKNSESATQYKSQISQEIARLKTTQISGGQEYEALSAEEKKAFVKKFQNNNQHCGAVTQVMQERTRILLNPKLSKILGSTIKDIP